MGDRAVVRQDQMLLVFKVLLNSCSFRLFYFVKETEETSAASPRIKQVKQLKLN